MLHFLALLNQYVEASLFLLIKTHTLLLILFFISLIFFSYITYVDILIQFLFLCKKFYIISGNQIQIYFFMSFFIQKMRGMFLSKFNMLYIFISVKIQCLKFYENQFCGQLEIPQFMKNTTNLKLNCTFLTLPKEKNKYIYIK